MKIAGNVAVGRVSSPVMLSPGLDGTGVSSCFNEAPCSNLVPNAHTFLACLQLTLVAVSCKIRCGAKARILGRFAVHAF